MKRSFSAIALLIVGVAALLMAAAEPSGNISASPNPCTITNGQKMCTTYLTWSTENVRHARVYVIAHGTKGREENLFSGARSCQRCPAPWIEKGPYTFRLYDYSTGNRGKNLAAVSVTGKP